MAVEAMLQPHGPAGACRKPRACANDPLLVNVSDLCTQVEKVLSTEEAALDDRKRTLARLWTDIDELRDRFAQKKPVFKIMGLEFPLPENDALSSSSSSSDSPILSPLSYLPSPLSLADTRDHCTTRASKEDLGRTLSPSDIVVPHLRGRSKLQSMPPPPPPELQAHGPGSYAWSPTAESLANMTETTAGEAHVTNKQESDEGLGPESQSLTNQLRRARGVLGRAKSLGSMFGKKKKSAQGLPFAPAVHGKGWKFWKDY
ncbi:hypothetical protein HDU87_001336 [Geranomyces variabilis]|uniref:Uncharacterized protein n=1 Tax=Geranomyces variabilis TaxID=109894 RepID=A0AAD5XPE0_9FUNG|nr:hypothetical protein HDU87_001336 [Geranomyces variabilis]